MNYLKQAEMVDDYYLAGRIAACAATLGITEGRPWAVRNMWFFSAQPGWADAYADATGDEAVTDPANWSPYAGADPSVITDQMIQTAVQQFIASQNPPETLAEPG